MSLERHKWNVKWYVKCDSVSFGLGCEAFPEAPLSGCHSRCQAPQPLVGELRLQAVIGQTAVVVQDIAGDLAGIGML